MKKIAIFVEGQTELIFVRELLLKIFEYKISFDCYKLRKGMLNNSKYPYTNPNSKIYFFIVDTGCDEKVISIVKDQERKLFSEGYEEIFCLRDMYSTEYRNNCNKDYAKNIDFSVIKKIIQGKNNVIDKMSAPDKIKFYFAIMEIEAWFLAFYKIFEKIDGKLTVEYIKEKLKIDLEKIDPEKEFFKPSDKLNKILKLSRIEYNKSENVAEKLVSKMEVSDFDEVESSGKVSCFVDFYGDLKRAAV